MKLEQLFERYRPFIPDYGDFLDSIQRPLLQSFRINTLKAKKNAILLLLDDLKIKQLPYYDDGFVLQQRASLGKHVCHSLGYVYVQEIASMIPCIVLDPQPDEYVLDLCAAPGSKSTQIAQMMKNRGLLVANEINRRRTQGLVHNIKRCGVYNEAIVNIKGQRIDRILRDYFDRVLVDAPCSAEGTIRKSKSVLYHWGERNIVKMSRIQKGLIVSGFRSLRPGGTMVYSTCTLAPEENEEVIAYLLQRFPEAELLPVTLPRFKTRPGITKWNIESYDEKVRLCARIMPQDNDTAPFFVAKITKRGIQKHRVAYRGKVELEGSAIQLLAQQFGIAKERFAGLSVFRKDNVSYVATPEVFSFWEVKAVRRGLEIGKIYDNEIKPDDDFVQIFGYNPLRNMHSVKEWQLKKLLQGEALSVGLQPHLGRGFVIVVYKSMPVAIGKYNGTVVKPMVKPNRRIPR